MIGTPIGVEHNQQRSDAKDRLALTTAAVLIGVLLTAMPASAQIQTAAASSTASTMTTILNAPPAPQARIIEWDLPSAADMSPGAIVVDTLGHDKNQNRLFFVTRTGIPQRVYRMDFPRSLMKGAATWTAWQLSDVGIITGGIRRVRASYDRRYVFVRTASSIQRVDTQSCTSGSSPTCQVTVWQDQDGLDTSDVAVDDRNNVYSTHNGVDPTLSNPPPTESGLVQRLTPGPTPYSDASVTRWSVGGGAGECVELSLSSSPCPSGIAVHPTNRYLIYYSEPTGNNISELNTLTNKVRRWSLTAVPVTAGTAIRQPRQLHVDRWGKIWVVTGSGHLVSLDPYTNRVTRHQMPDQDGADPFGLAPDDDVVGYTVSSEGLDKVGVVFPKGDSFYVPPTPPANVPYSTQPVAAVAQWTGRQTGTVPPVGKTVLAQVTPKADGTFIEAQLNTCAPSAGSSNCTVNDSQIPLGITPVKGKAEGTFFYAVGRNASIAKDGTPANRVGFVRFPVKEKVKHPRDDDDENDGFDGDHDWHNWHGHATGDDDDDDGLANGNDQHTMNERDAQADDQKSSPATIGAGQFAEYPVATTATSVAIVAMTQAIDPLAQIGIEVYDPSGLLVATSAPAPGIAVATVPLPVVGTYRVRVRNYGATSVTHTPTLLVREPWQP